MDVASYFARIGYDGPTSVTHETLRQLHRAHCLRVPFENLDIQLGRKIDIDPIKTFEKVIRKHRGGFCYELNALFGALIEEMGFQVSVLEGRVIRNGAKGLSHGHMMLKVDLEDPWLVDVGFGDGSLDPLSLSVHDVVVQKEGRFQIRRDGETYAMWCQTLTEELAPQYEFDLQPRQFEEFEERCVWTQTSSDSGFTQRLICTLPIEGGRTGILGSERVTFVGGEKTVEILSHVQRNTLLKEFFEIDLEGAKLP